MQYTFHKSNLYMVTTHATSLDIEVLSLALVGDIYTMVTAQPFPEEQLDHLGLTEV